MATLVCTDCKTAKYVNGIPLCNTCGDSHGEKAVFEGHQCISIFKFLRRRGNTRCSKHLHKTMEMYCKGCCECLCSVCALLYHIGHNLLLLQEAADGERSNIGELCVDADIFVEEMVKKCEIKKC